MKRFFVLICILLIATSCAPKKNLIYMQNIDQTLSQQQNSDFQPVIQPDDLLLIIISGDNPETSSPFNLITYAGIDNSSELAQGGVRFQSYLVNAEGAIDMPILGRVVLGGLNKLQAIEKIKSLLKEYITNPIVNFRIINYKVSVLGEVANPGTFQLQTERITLPEAISRAGDLTIYGDRKNVLVIREENGKKVYKYIDLTNADFINSPYYYLDQNDVVYVNPNKTKINSSVIGPNVTVGISAVSLLITIIALLSR